MDRKTLEYMEERDKKARMIVKQIDLLSKTALQVVNSEKVIFWNYSGSVNIETKLQEILKPLISAYIEEVNKIINRLEQELSEL